MKYLPPLKSLQTFLAAAQNQSFKRAAEQLNVTQAAVSQQIRQLEQNLQLKLFDRSGKQTVLTEQGSKLLPYMQRGFEELSNGIQAVSGDPEPNVLRLSTLHSFTSLWLIPRLQEFQKLHPHIMVQLAPANELVDFKQSNIDLAIRMGRGGYTGLVEKKILNDNLIFVASPALVKDIDITNVQQVFALPWIDDTSRGIQECLLQYCQQMKVDRDSLKPIIQSSNAVPLIESAVEGRGVVMANSSLVVEHLRSGRLVTLLDFSCQSPYSLYLVAPEEQFGWQKVCLFEQWFTPKVAESFADLDLW
ncbi:MAG: LysR family glycine cleavage system transcriptional activator [Phenylobacterium sp.]|jgi:LysR family glycine cleavage system transcriptional activator